MSFLFSADYYEVRKNGISPAQNMAAYLGGSAIQTVGDNPVTAYRQLVQQYAKGLDGQAVDPKVASSEANAVFMKTPLTASLSGLWPRLIGVLFKRIPKFGFLLGIAALSRARSPAARQAVVIEKGGSKKSSCASWPTEHMNAGQTVGPCTYPVETQHFVLEGKVVLKEEGAGEKTMEAGDFVTFQKGTKVTWDVKEKFNAHFQVNGAGPLDDGWTRPCA